MFFSFCFFPFLGEMISSVINKSARIDFRFAHSVITPPRYSAGATNPPFIFSPWSQRMCFLLLKRERKRAKTSFEYNKKHCGGGVRLSLKCDCCGSSFSRKGSSVYLADEFRGSMDEDGTGVERISAVRLHWQCESKV